MKQVLTVLVFLLMSIGVWAGEVVIVKNPSNGGEVSASQAAAGETCTLTVTPYGNYQFVNWTLKGSWPQNWLY